METLNYQLGNPDHVMPRLPASPYAENIPKTNHIGVPLGVYRQINVALRLRFY